MNFRLLSHTMGYILWVEAGFLLLPALTACIYAETCWQQFLLTALLCATAGTVLHLIPVKKTQMHSRDGFAAVALSWVLLSLFGALPYVFTGVLDSYIDAVFETVSGLTTTGSSTFTAVSHLPRSVLLWRSLTQWMGGMGVLVLFLALTPRMGEARCSSCAPKAPAPSSPSWCPRWAAPPKILYLIYVVLTLCEVLALRLAGESWFSAVCHSFTTMATGGFSIYDTSLAGASKAVMWIITVFSFLAGVNFSLMFLAVRGKLKEVLRSEELRIYVGIVAAATLLLCINLRVQAGGALPGFHHRRRLPDCYHHHHHGLCHRGFLPVAYLLPHGTGDADVHRRLRRLHLRRHQDIPRRHSLQEPEAGAEAAGAPPPCQCAEGGRTGRGGAGRLLRRRVYRGIPAGAAGGRTGGQLGQLRLSGVLRRLSDLHQQLGPGLGILGPMENFSILSPLSKLVLSLEMLMGRLELMPLLALFLGSTWRD